MDSEELEKYLINEDDEIMDTLNITDTITYISYQGKEIWDSIPIMLWNSGKYMYSLFGTVWTKCKSYILIELTQNMNYLKTCEFIWVYLRASENIDRITDKILNKRDTKEMQRVCKLLNMYVSTNKREAFLNFCLTNENNKELQLVIKYFKKKIY